VEGARYAVQYKDRLSDAAWSELAGGIAMIPGSDAQKDDVTATNTMQRFYRIVLRE
jgi:hypothetical protein